MTLPAFLNLRHPHTFLQMLGFYITAFLGTALLGVVIVMVVPLFQPTLTLEQGYALSNQVATIVSTAGSLLLAILIAWKKNRLSKLESIFFILLSGVLGYVGGTLLGMVTPALMTMQGKKE